MEENAEVIPPRGFAGDNPLSPTSSFDASGGACPWGEPSTHRSELKEGGEEIDYNRSVNNGPRNVSGNGSIGGQRAAADTSQTVAPAQRKKLPKKIKRYESNSIDEEEFQDYFTNPIKRKEFDRQRKKQQMREMQNITGFTLGQFGIKSMKAMREAMPAYPDDDDQQQTQDAQKNYATVSLCCLSVTNPFRNKIIQIVAVNPWFDRFILLVIMANCVFLALDNEVETITKKMEMIDMIFLVIYTMEMVMKIIAMGFFMRAHSYLRDSWNILDFVVVILGWTSQIFEGSDISAIKVIRILRPLRTINQIPNMSSLVATILNSLPIMFDVMVLFFFMLIMFGTIYTQLLGGSLQNICMVPATGQTVTIGGNQITMLPEGVDMDTFNKLGQAYDKKGMLTYFHYNETVEVEEDEKSKGNGDEEVASTMEVEIKPEGIYHIINNQTKFMLPPGEFGIDDIRCMPAAHEQCQDLVREMNLTHLSDESEVRISDVMCVIGDNPIDNTYSFDNILLSIMNIFQIITLEGWTDMMYIVRDVQGTVAYDFLFISCVVFGSFVILNLMIAVQASYLDKAFDEEANRQKEIQEKLETKRKFKLEQEQEEEYYEEDMPEEEVFDEDQAHDYDNNPENSPGRRRSTRSRKKTEQKKKGCLDCKKPDWFVKFSNNMEEMCESKLFERLIIVLIMINTLFLASEHYEQPDWLTKISDGANIFFTIIFALEMVVKLIGFGFKKYAADGFNLFDCFIVIMSYVELFMPGEASSLSVLRAFRLLRIFKIIKSWDSLRILLSTVLDSLTAITNLGVLIILFLFISALLTKQFYSEDDIRDPEEGVRYSFSSTGTALISVFIILTGENWNEIMVLVIDKEKSFTPSLLFIMLMILGNFMLLNLFLAILLKSISEIGNDDEGGEEEEAKPDKDAFASVDEALKAGMNDSAPLNSSNSNIEEEFEQIKNQLMALSENMNAILDGNFNLDNLNQLNLPKPEEEEEDENMSVSLDSEKQKEAEEKKKKEAAQAKIRAQLAQSQTEEHKQEEQIGNSLFIFSPTNPLRKWLRGFVMNSYFAGFIYHMIALNSLLLALDEPKLDDEYQKVTISELLNIISIIFVVECGLKIIVQGFYFGEKTFLKDPWNILDFIIVLFSILTWVLEATTENQDISFIRGFRALRALRPLRVVSKNEGIKTVVNSLLQSIPALLNVLLIVILFLAVFGILGIQLFKGQLGRCWDENFIELDKIPCLDAYIKENNLTNGTEGIYIGLDELTAEQKREAWVVPFNNYDDIMHSMMTFFEISTLEMWPGMMYNAIDGTGLDKAPFLDNNQFISLVFIIFIFFTTFFIMNLFISVIVDKFNEEIKKRQGSDNFTDEQKEWVKIQRLLVHTNPKIIPVEPINCFRLQCFKIVQSQAFEYVVMSAIVINTFFLCIDYYGKSEELEKVLNNSNTSFVVFFTMEMILKITAYGFEYYWYVNWNKFDFIIVIMSLVALDEDLLEKLNFNPTALRIIRVSRLLRMVKTSEGLRTLLKTLFMSLGNIINTAALLTLILFTFGVAGMSLFGQIPEDSDELEFINSNVNFRSFYLAMMTLWRASTGESWNGIMHECFDSEGIIAVIFWLLFQLIAFFIFMNVFIAVIGESFNDNQATEDENDILALKKKDIKAFQNTWAKYNPMGELYMRTVRLPDFLRELPPPLGYQGIRIEESKLNKIIFCLNIRDHLGKVYYPEVMWTIFHSIAGMNDDKVLKCEQIINILKVVKSKYKGLGKKVSLDSLCGNKYYRKELTAIKYIQAMKILTKWRNFKNQKIKQKELGILSSPNSHTPPPPTLQPKEEPKKQEPNRLYAEPREGANGIQNLSAQLEPYENNSAGESRNNNGEDVRQQRLQNIQRAVQKNREEVEMQPVQSSRRGGNTDRRQVYHEEDSREEPEARRGQLSRRERGGAAPLQDFDDIESADQDMPVTERNPISARDQGRNRHLQRDADRRKFGRR